MADGKIHVPLVGNDDYSIPLTTIANSIQIMPASSSGNLQSTTGGISVVYHQNQQNHQQPQQQQQQQPQQTHQTNIQLHNPVVRSPPPAIVENLKNGNLSALG